MPDEILTGETGTGGEQAAATPDNNIPSNYSDYLKEKEFVLKPLVRLPVDRKAELFNAPTQFIQDVANDVKQQYDKVSQPDMLNLSNTIADLNADKIQGVLGNNPIEDPTSEIKLNEPKLKELSQQAKDESGAEIKNWQDIVGKTVPVGTLIKVDDYFKNHDVAFLNALQRSNPTWTGEYLQMQHKADGTVVPKAYNMAAAFKDNPTSLVGDLAGVTVYGDKKVSDEDAKKWYDNEIANTQIEDQQKLKTGEAKFGDYAPSDRLKDANLPLPVVKLLMNNKDLYDNFKEELNKSEGGDVVGQGGQSQTLAKAIAKTYDFDKVPSQDSYDAVANANGLRQFQYQFNKKQNDLASKIKIIGEANIDPAILNQYTALQTKLLTNPSGVTDQDKRDYATMTMQMNDQIAKSGSQAAQQLWGEYQNNNKQFATILKQTPQLLQGAATPEGQEGINILLKQQKGTYLINTLSKYFPELKAKEDKQDAANASGSDVLSIPKSLYSGTVSGTQSVVKGAANLMGGDRFEAMMAGRLSNQGEFENNPNFVTPERPTDTGNKILDFWNTTSNVVDAGAKQVGQMVLPMAMTIASGGSSIAELTPFALQSYHDTELQMRRAGVPQNYAEGAGLVNAALTALTMKLAFMPSKILAGKIENIGMKELLDNNFSRQSIGDYLMKFAPTKGDAKTTFMAASQGLAMQIADYVQNEKANKQFGTNLATDQLTPNNILTNAAGMAGITYALGTLSRFGDKKAATQLALKYADENPTMFAAALDHAKSEAMATGRFDINRINELQSNVARFYLKQHGMPAGMNSDQQIAAYDILDKIATLKGQLEHVDPEFKTGIETQIKDAQKQLDEVSHNDKKAIDYNNKVVNPALQELKKNGYFDKSPAPKFEEPAVEKEHTITVDNLEDIPEQFRDRAVKNTENLPRKKILGIEYGKQKTKDTYTYKVKQSELDGQFKEDEHTGLHYIDEPAEVPQDEAKEPVQEAIEIPKPPIVKGEPEDISKPIELSTETPAGEYKPQIRDDYFIDKHFTPDEKVAFDKLDEAGKDKMIDDKRKQLDEKVENTNTVPSLEKTPEQKTKEFDDALKSNDAGTINNWLLNNAKEGDTIMHDDGTGYKVDKIWVSKNGKKNVGINIIDEDGTVIGYHQITETEPGSGISSDFSNSKIPPFRYGYTDLEGNRKEAIAKYNSNETELPNPKQDTVPSLEDKRNDIERRRKEELQGKDIKLEDIIKPGNKFTSIHGDKFEVVPYGKDKIIITKNGDSTGFIIDKDPAKWDDHLRDSMSYLPYAAGKVDISESNAKAINAKYDAELKALEDESKKAAEISKPKEEAGITDAGVDKVEQPAAEKGIAEKSKDLANKFRKLKSSRNQLNAHIFGVGVAIYDGAMETAARIIENGGKLIEAIQGAIEYARKRSDNFDEEGFRKHLEDIDAGEKPKVRVQVGEGTEPKPTGIKHSATEEIRQKHGLGDYERTPTTDEELRKKAKEIIDEGDGYITDEKGNTVKKPYDIEKLLAKTEAGNPPNGVENEILKIYGAGLEKQVAENPSDENLAKLNRFVKALDKAGTQASEQLRTRKGMAIQDESLAGFFVREQDANKGAPLTENQKSTVIKEHEDISAAQKEYDAKIEALEKENAKLKAEKQVAKIKKETEKSQKKTHEDYVKERKDIAASIKDKWKKAGRDVLSSDVPYRKQVAAITPDVLKLAKSLIEEGVDKLGDVVKSIHDTLKEDMPELQEKDVHDILAGEYAKKQGTRKEAAEKLFNLRMQAKLESKLERILLGEEPKNEKERIARTQEIEDLRNKIKDYRQEQSQAESARQKAIKDAETAHRQAMRDAERLAERERKEAERLAEKERRDAEREANKKTPEEIALNAIKTRTKNEIARIEKQLEENNFEEPVKEPVKLDKEAIELRDKLLQAKEERELRLMKREYENEPLDKKSLRIVGQALNTGRVLKSSFDVSMPFRQGIWGLAKQLLSSPSLEGGKLTFPQQKLLREQFSKMYQSLGSENAARRIMADIHESPRYELAQKSGLAIAEPSSLISRFREDTFGASLVEKIPILGKPIQLKKEIPVFGDKVGGFIKASERSATAFVNQMKWDIFNDFVDQFESKGKTFENSPKDYEYAAMYANQAVGRGKLGESIEKANEVTSRLFFSLRLQASRLQLLTNFANPWFYKNAPIEVRRAYFKDMAKFTALGLTTLGIAKSLGLSVGVNPFSANFGKIKMGNTTIDIWGGFQQWVVFLLREGLGKAEKGGQIVDMGDKGAPTRGDVFARFARSKASPEAGAALDLLYGKDYIGKPVTLTSELENYLVPLIGGDIKDAYNDGGIARALLVWILSSHGVGTQTYDQTKPQSKTKTQSRHQNRRVIPHRKVR